MLNEDGVDPQEVHTCERCFSRATAYVQDSRCIGWAKANPMQVTVGNLPAGSYFLRWEPDGPIRFFCHRHMRKPREFDKEMIARNFADAHPELVTLLSPVKAQQLKAQRLGLG